VALAGLKEAALATRCADAKDQVILEKMEFPGSGHRDRDRAEVEGRSGEARCRARQLAAEDPSFRSRPMRSRPDILKGMASSISTSSRHPQAHLQGRSNIGAPQVAIAKESPPVTIDYQHKKQTGRHGPIRPGQDRGRAVAAGTGFGVRKRGCRGSVPKEFFRRREGPRIGAGRRVIAGFPVVDLKVTLIDGRYHEVDFLGARLEIAARGALREALQKGHSVLLEPIMKVECVTPEDYTGSVIGDLNSRRGQSRARTCAATPLINAMVPLANMFGYVNHATSMSQGPPPSRCSSTTTSRFQATSPRKSRRSSRAPHFH